MKRKAYSCPVVKIDVTEVQNMMAVSFDTGDVDWRDDVDLEAKEAKGEDDNWDNIW